MLEAIALELADSIAKIIGYDVVIADIGGTILGCSDRSRGIGTLNEACEIVGRTGKPRIETEEDAARLKGTKIGVTYPIMDSSGYVVGSVAITGDPEKVKPFALLVKKQAELHLREHIITKELLEKERNLQSLMADIALFKQGVNDPNLIEDKAVLMGYDPQKPYFVLVMWVELGEKLPSDKRSELYERDRVLMELRNAFSGPGEISGPISQRQYVIFKAAQDLDASSSDSRIELEKSLLEQCNQLAQSLEKFNFSVRIGVGSLNQGVVGVVNSYREAQRALQIGGKVFPRKKVNFIGDLRVEELLMGAERNLQEHMAKRELGALLSRNDGDELLDTIQAWCENGFSVVKAAETLHVHRTTVDYRLEKLSHILGVEPRNFRQMSQLYWAVVLQKLNKPRKANPRHT